MIDNQMVYYAMAIVAIVIGVILLKRFVSCALRIIVTVALMALLAYIYITYLQ